jgi:hypothetical protein
MTVPEVRTWANARVKEWNWNASRAEVAKELIDAEIQPDTPEWEVTKAVFLKFFDRTETAQKDWEEIERIVEVFQ